MTQTVTQPEKKADGVLQLPQASFPLVNRVLSTAPFPPDGASKRKTDEPILWVLGEDHPVVPDLRIMRMYLIHGVAVEVYSQRKDGKVGVRHTLPWSTLRLVEEVMDPPTFIAEVESAEKGEDEEPDALEELPSLSANGSAS